MTPENEHLDADQQLWERFREALIATPAHAEPSTADLAAWLEAGDTLAPEQVAAIDAAIAAGSSETCSPGAILAIREAIAAADESMDDAVLSRITQRAIVLDPARTVHNHTHAPVLWIFPAIRRGLAAAAALGICVLGWQAGQSWAGAPTPVIDATALASEMTFGLLDVNDFDADLMAFDLASFATEEASR